MKDSVAGFGLLKNHLRSPCILVKRGGTFVGPMSLVCLKMWLINGLLKLDLSQQTRGIVSAFSSMDHFKSGYDPPLLLGSGLRLNDWSSALRLASHLSSYCFELSSGKCKSVTCCSLISHKQLSAFCSFWSSLSVSMNLPPTHILFIESF